MTLWEKRIIGAFIERYPSSAAAAVSDPARAVVSGGGEGPDGKSPSAKTPRPQRLRPDRIVPGIDRASPDDRVSFLEAAESLEGRGLLTLVWARHRKGETLSALVCRDPELLYELAGKDSPKTTAEKVRAAARLFALTASLAEDRRQSRDTGEAALFSFLAENFTPPDAAGGIDVIAVTDLARLTRFLFDEDESPSGLSPASDTGPTPDRPRREKLWRGKVRGITTRALSTALYGDSKRLEALMTLFNPLLARAKRQGRRQGTAVPDFSFLDRSYPETFIAGKIILDFEKRPSFPENAAGEISPAGDGETVRPSEAAAGKTPPLVNACGNILGLPLETILELRRIRPYAGEAAGEAPARALMIENKETFFALSASLPGYSCFLYVGGHPNRAVRALAALLAESGFSLSHAGDLDPDGILILQELAEITGKPVQPLRMDADTFDRYLECGKKLEPTTLKRTALISEKTRSIPGMAELVRRIEETGMGVEQEIIDYREEEKAVQDV
jgi:hypothetical protein